MQTPPTAVYPPALIPWTRLPTTAGAPVTSVLADVAARPGTRRPGGHVPIQPDVRQTTPNADPPRRLGDATDGRPARDPSGHGISHRVRDGLGGGDQPAAAIGHPLEHVRVHLVPAARVLAAEAVGVPQDRH